MWHIVIMLLSADGKVELHKEYDFDQPTRDLLEEWENAYSTTSWDDTHWKATVISVFWVDLEED